MTLSFYAQTTDVLTKLSPEDKKELHDLLENGIKSGVVKPFPRVVYTISDLSKLQEYVFCRQILILK